MTTRISKLKAILKRERKLPYLISSLTNIRYLTGFSGSYAALVVDDPKCYFISDSRYQEYAESILSRPFEFVLQDKEFSVILLSLLKRLGHRKLFLEEHSLTLSSFLAMKKKLKGVTLAPGGDEVNTIRIVKDSDEIALLREASAITDRCFNHLLKMIKPGIVEWDIAVEIDYFYKKNGCAGISFDSIVASGAGSSMPHYATSMTKKISPGDAVLIDMGCVYNGYNSDLTRTVFMNRVDDRFREIYAVVRDAQQKALGAAKPGVTTGKLDSAARSYIASKGYGDRFGHSLGHGVGLEVHELPAVKSGGDSVLKKNSVITIEPGVYIPGFGGVRIEDTVLISHGGCERLTTSTKEIIIL